MKLDWQNILGPEYGKYWAYCGNIQVGWIARPREGTTEWRWFADSAVFTKWVVKGRGKSNSEANAKRAVTRAWRIWLAHAGLTPRTRPQPSA
jgi:hypothetical protein